MARRRTRVLVAELTVVGMRSLFVLFCAFTFASSIGLLALLSGCCPEMMSCPETERTRKLEGDLTLVESKATFERAKAEHEEFRRRMLDAGVYGPDAKAPTTSRQRSEIRPGDVDTSAGFSPLITILETCAYETTNDGDPDESMPCMAIGIQNVSRYEVRLFFDLPRGAGTYPLRDLHAVVCEGRRPSLTCFALTSGELVVREVAPPCGYYGLCARLDADLHAGAPESVPDDAYARGQARIFYRDAEHDKPCESWGAPPMTPMR